MKEIKLNQAEDKILNDYLAGKSHLSGAYKNIETDLPGIDIDSAILAAARREAGSRPHALGASGWRKWQIPFSIAAVLVVSASLTMVMSDHQNKLDELSVQVKQSMQEENKIASGDNAASAKPVMPQPDSTPSAVPAPSMRKLDPVERNKQKMQLPQLAEVKTDKSELKIASAITTPPSEEKKSAPPEAARVADATIAMAKPSLQTEQIAAEKSAKREPEVAAAPAAAPMPAPAPRNESAAFPSEANREATLARAPAAMPATADFASAPRQAKSIGTAQSSRASAARVAEETSGSLSASAPPQKAVLLNETETVAAYSASQTWLAKIEALLREGKTEEAEQTLADFKKRFPNYITPDSIKEELAKQRAALNAEPK